MKTVFWRSLFWLLWPLIWLYAPLRSRSRLLVVSENSVLLVLPYFGNGAWQLPGGGVKFGETTEAAAVRELFEETGIRVKKVDLLAKHAVYVEAGVPLRYVIYATTLSKKSNPTCNAELQKCAWVTLDQAKKLNLAHHVRKVLQQTDTTLI